jgi:hypothetical protein
MHVDRDELELYGLKRLPQARVNEIEDPFTDLLDMPCDCHGRNGFRCGYDTRARAYARHVL